MSDRYAFLETLYQFYDDVEYWPKMRRAANRYVKFGFVEIGQYINARADEVTQ